MTASLRLAHGPLAVEALLVADVIERARALARDPRALTRTLTIVVPSESLRLHLCARLVAARGRALAGLRVTTLHGLAASVLDRALAPAPRGAAWFAIVVRRIARAEPALARELERYERGFDSAVTSVSDFFDAGFEPEHAEALLDALADPQTAERADPRTLERARALVRLASSVALELAALGAEHRSGALARATVALTHDSALLGGDVWIRGFADATGRASDLIECLAHQDGARVYVDTATIPASASDGMAAFGQRFRERLSIPVAPEIAPPLSPALLEAPGPEAEVRAVAERIRALLDRGVSPESIGVVARDLDPLRLAIRRSFTRLGVPFSGLGAHGSNGPVERRIEALFEVLRSPERAPIERWLGATGLSGDLPLALRSLGIARVGALAELQIEHAPIRNGVLPLPVRRGSWSDDDDAAMPLRRRSVPLHAVERARDGARALCAAVERWPATASFAKHRDEWRRILEVGFAWDSRNPGARALEEVVDGLVRECGGAGLLDRSEFLRLVVDTWREECAPTIGGAGSGVQCLSVVEARARTFEHLFVIALDRGVFPRRVREDPLLPDTLRAPLSTVLPDLPLKSLGHEEERALFEELVRASADVTLSWRTMDEDGSVSEPSPFVEALFPVAKSLELARAVHDPTPDRSPRAARPAHESLVLAALAGDRARYARLLPLAFVELGSPAAPDAKSAAELARATHAILEEIDTPAYERPGLTPYLGTVGKPVGADPRQRPLYVTTLEGLADCGWRTFLRSLLQVEPPPDPLDALPAIDARLVGDLVHRVLDAIVDLPSGTLEDAAARTPRAIRWPAASALDATVVKLASELLREEGLTLPGFAHILAHEAEAYLAVARALDESRAPVAVCGSEVTGTVTLGNGARKIAFRADRAERSADGLTLVDFKTGKPISKHKTSAKREEKLTDAIASGTKLQAAAYAFASDVGAEGRYVFLGPDLPDESRVARVLATDGARRETLQRTVTTLLDAYDAGAFLPRLLTAKLEKEHPHCEYCEVADACVRGDSGARARLSDWARRDAPGADDQAARALWRLADSTSDDHGGDES
jgi:RecB family exonuclease